MNAQGWLQLGLYVVVLLLLVKPLGAYMAAVYEGRAMRAQRIGGPLERLIYRGAGVDPDRDMRWTEYAMAMLWFNLVGASPSMRCSACSSGCRSIRRRWRRSAPIRRSTRQRASSPTPTGRATAARAR